MRNDEIKPKKMKYARITLTRNTLSIENVNNRPVHPENSIFLGKKKDIEQALIEFINKWFTKPVVIEITKVKRSPVRDE